MLFKAVFLNQVNIQRKMILLDVLLAEQNLYLPLYVLTA